MATLTTTISYGEPAGSMVATLGAPGPAGQSATVAVGSTTTGAPGTDALVVNVGTSSAAVLDFTIPRGDAGAQGPQGIPGNPGLPGTAATIAVGSTATGAPGSSSSVVNVGTSSAAIFDFTIPRGDVGAQGPQGVPGVVSASSPLNYNAGTQNISIDLSAYLTVSTAASTYQPLSGMSAYLTKAGNLAGLTNLATARDNLNLGTLNTPTFAGVTAQGSGANLAQLTPTSLSLNHADFGSFSIQPSSGITFPDSTVQTTAYTGTEVVVWGDVQGTLSNQADLQSALDAKYDASNPAGFIDQAYGNSVYYPLSGNPSAFITMDSLAGYATESWVNSQGFLTTAILDGYARLDGANFTGACDFSGELGFSGNGYFNAHGIDSDGRRRIRFGQGVSGGFFGWGDFGFDGSNLVYGNGENAPETVASQKWVKAGLLFDGKVRFTSVSGQAGLNVGIGGTSTNANVPGDLWISAGGTNLNFRDATGSWRILVNTSNTNTFSAPQIVDTTSTTAALRVTQKGTGNAIEVEDSTTPDATRFVVDQFGKVGVGTAPDATAAIRLDGNGMSFNGLSFNATGTSAHTGGSDTLDLLVTINGVNYRLGLRPA